MLRFHDVCGNNIQLQENHQRAVRHSSDSFCDGITFSHEPLEVGEMYSIGIQGRNDGSDWSGALTLGVTTEDPKTISNLPKYASPDLANRDGFWARPLNEDLARNGTRLSLSLTASGDLQLWSNSHCYGAHLTDLPIQNPMWLIVDIFGSTQAVQFHREDNVPIEILARGPEALEAYSKLRKLGTAQLFRGRVFLAGLDSAGKKWLKVALLGESEAHDSETPLEGVRCRRWCSISKDGMWKTKHRHDKHNANLNNTKNLVEPIRIESDFDAALARNLALEIIKSQQNKKRDQFKLRSASDKSRVRLNSSDSFGHNWRSNFKPTTSASSHRSIKRVNRVAPVSSDNGSLGVIPPRLIPLVENHLKELKKKGHDVLQRPYGQVHCDQKNSLDGEVPNEITISFWELGGHPDLIPVLHPFISGEGVYILVFDLLQDLDAQSKVVEWDEKISQFVVNESSFYTNIGILLSWINLIYQQRTHSDTSVASIIIVGLNRQNLHPDVKTQENLAKLKFDQIRDSFRGAPFESLVSTSFFAIDTSSERPNDKVIEDSDFVSSDVEDSDDDVDIDEIGTGNQVHLLQMKVYQLLISQPTMGQYIPESWVGFEKILAGLVDRGIIYAKVDEIFEKTDGKTDMTTFRSCLRLYHNLGMILFWGHEKFVESATGNDEDQDSYSLDQTVILCIQSFATLLTCINSPHYYLKMRSTLSSYDSHEDETIGKGPLMAKKTLKSITDFYDWDVDVVRIILSALKFIRSLDENQNFLFIPLLHTRRDPMDDLENTMSTKSVLVIFETLSIFPESVFHKLINSLFGKMRNKNLNIKLISPICFEFEPDDFHVVLVKMQSLSSCHSIRLYIKRKFEFEQKLPSPMMCSIVLRDVESSLMSLLSSWFPRVSFVAKVPCPCSPVCKVHQKLHCHNEECIHLVVLSEALTSSVVWCGYKQFNTAPIKKLFSFSGESDLESERRLSPKKFSLPVSPPDLSTLFHLRSPAIHYGHRSHPTSSNPSWMKGAAKLLESGSVDDDWRAVGKLLGYKDHKLDEFENTFQASRVLLKDWLDSCNGSKLSVEMLCACLKEINRLDVLEIIRESDEEHNATPPAQVFISYQWDNQSEVLLIRSQLENAGLTCWMDVGQMGGGDHLYNEIYRGIFSCQVVVCCLTSRYVVSDSCTKEISLADLLRKPIVPIMVEKTPWPPPGSLALLLSQLVFIDLAGSGGHGGTGKHSDWSAKMGEIVRRVRLYTSPNQLPQSSGPTGLVPTAIHRSHHQVTDASLVRVVEVGGGSSNTAEVSVDAHNDAGTSTGVTPPALFFWGQPEATQTEERRRRCCRRIPLPSHCTIL